MLSLLLVIYAHAEHVFIVDAEHGLNILSRALEMQTTNIRPKHEK
jgi:hypothetical protein